jgi:hypothetical protein
MAQLKIATPVDVTKQKLTRGLIHTHSVGLDPVVTTSVRIELRVDFPFSPSYFLIFEIF